MSTRPIRLAGPESRPQRPLVVTSDDQLLDDILRLAAAAGVEVDVVPDAGSARSQWARPPVLIIGPDQVAALASLGSVRRSGVLVIGGSPDDTVALRGAVALRAEHVLSLPADEVLLTERLADAAEGESADATVVGVIGGRGGAGASVFATALAIAGIRQGLPTMLIDLDPWGGGLDLVLGAEQAAGVRWPELAGTRGRLGTKTLLAELPARRNLTVVSSDRGQFVAISPDAAGAVTSAGRRGCDLVVIDLPRYLDPAADSALTQCTSVLLVVPTEVRAVAAAARVAGALTTATADVRVVARSTSASLSGADVAAALDLPLALEMPDEPRLAERLERGDPPGTDGSGPLAIACATLLDDLGAQRAPHAA